MNWGINMDFVQIIEIPTLPEWTEMQAVSEI